MEAQQLPCAAIEDIERRAGAGVDFKEERLAVTHNEVGRGEPPDRKGAGGRHNRRRHPPRQSCGDRRRRDRAAITPRTGGKGRRPLLAEAKHACAASIGDEERRHGTPRDALLVIDIGGALRAASRDNMAAAGPAAFLGEPGTASRRFACRGRMRNAEAVEFGKKLLRRLEARDGGGVGAKQLPAFGDQPQQFRPILEAGPVDETENGRGSKLGQRLERGIKGLPAQPALDAAR